MDVEKLEEIGIRIRLDLISLVAEVHRLQQENAHLKGEIRKWENYCRMHCGGGPRE